MTRCTLMKDEREIARQDIRKILSLAPDEVAGVRDALVAGQINGKLYKGECCCLVGTIAKLRGTTIQKQQVFYPFDRAIRADENRPAERFFWHIRSGDIPKTSQWSKLALAWIDEWINENAERFTQILEVDFIQDTALSQSR